MEKVHTGTVLQELQPAGRTHNGEVCEGWEGPHTGAGEKHEEEGAAGFFFVS